MKDRILTDDNSFIPMSTAKKAGLVNKKPEAIVPEKTADVVVPEENEQVSELPKDLSECTVPELRAYCAERKIVPNKKDLKADLIALLSPKELDGSDDL